MTTISPIEILVCPHCGGDLRIADGKELTRVNELIRKGKLKTQAGKPIKKRANQMLCCAQKDFAYLKRDDVWIMTPNDAIEMDDIKV